MIGQTFTCGCCGCCHASIVVTGAGWSRLALQAAGRLRVRDPEADDPPEIRVAHEHGRVVRSGHRADALVVDGPDPLVVLQPPDAHDFDRWLGLPPTRVLDPSESPTRRRIHRDVDGRLALMSSDRARTAAGLLALYDWLTTRDNDYTDGLREARKHLVNIYRNGLKAHLGRRCGSEIVWQHFAARSLETVWPEPRVCESCFLVFVPRTPRQYRCGHQRCVKHPLFSAELGEHHLGARPGTRLWEPEHPHEDLGITYTFRCSDCGQYACATDRRTLHCERCSTGARRTKRSRERWAKKRGRPVLAWRDHEVANRATGRWPPVALHVQRHDAR